MYFIEIKMVSGIRHGYTVPPEQVGKELRQLSRDTRVAHFTVTLPKQVDGD